MPITVSAALNVLHIGAYHLGDALIVVGLTGDIGAGKKTISKIMKSKHGYHIIDAGEIDNVIRKQDKVY